MRHLHLLVPDLILPKEAAPSMGDGLALPALEILLARSEHSMLPALSVEDFLCGQFGVRAVAPVRARADGLDVSGGYWLCADPVNLRFQNSQVVMRPEVSCSSDEAAALCAMLNAHFDEVGLRFFAPHPQRWYIRADSSGDVIMTPPSVVAWRDVKPHQPQGADALRWQRVGNEIQMLLHGHAVNQARESNGMPVINSLWLWGGGRAQMLQPGPDGVGGDEALSAAFARASGIAPSSGFAALLESDAEHSLWVCTALRDAWQSADLHAWREAVQSFESDVAQAALRAVRSGRVQRLTLEVVQANAAYRYESSRTDLWRVWRTRQPLAYYAV